jgi:hypothetical protein
MSAVAAPARTEAASASDSSAVIDLVIGTGTDALVGGLRQARTLAQTGGVEVQTIASGDGAVMRARTPVLRLSGDAARVVPLRTPVLATVQARSVTTSAAAELRTAARDTPVLLHGPAPASLEHPELFTPTLVASRPQRHPALRGALPAIVPDTLVAAHHGDPCAAAVAVAAQAPAGVAATVLVDFVADPCGEVSRIADKVGEQLAMVLLHGEPRMLGWDDLDFPPPGLTPYLVYAVRRALDEREHQDVAVGLSGCISPAAIRAFERATAPVDAYALDLGATGGAASFAAEVARIDQRTPSAPGAYRLPAA